MNTTYIAYGLIALLVLGFLLWVKAMVKIPGHRAGDLRKTTKRKPTRAERRATEKAQKEYARIRAHEWTLQGVRYVDFQKSIKDAQEQAKIHQLSLFKFTQLILGLVEEQIWIYQETCQKKHLIDQYMPNYYHVVMKHGIDAIMIYSDRKNLQSISDELRDFVEEHFRIRNLSGVYHRHRSYLNYTERSECMAVAILSFFSRNIASTTMQYATKPFDFLSDEDMTDFNAVNREFYRTAIDVHYADCAKSIERQNYAVRSQKDSIAHEKNRRQRSSRIKKQNRKRSKSIYA